GNLNEVGGQVRAPVAVTDDAEMDHEILRLHADLYAPRREASKGIRAMPSLAPPGQQGILTAPWKTSDARFDRPRVTSARRWQERPTRSGARRVAWRARDA